MNNKLIPIVITLVVGIILAGSVLMPVLNNATETERTFVNEGMFNYGIFTPEDNYTLTYSSATGLTVNGVATSIEGVSPGVNSPRYSVVAMENAIIRMGSNATSYALQVFGTNTDNQYMTNSFEDLTATITDGKFTISYTSSGTPASKTFDFTTMYAIVPSENDAIMKNSVKEAYIKSDSPLYASGQTTVTNWSNIFHFEGTYEDGITITSPALPEATYENIVWNIEPVSGFDDLYKLTSIEFDIVYNDATTHAVYSYFGVPSSVTAEKTNHLSDGEIALVKAIPILVIVALLVFAVGAIAYRRAD